MEDDYKSRSQKKQNTAMQKWKNLPALPQAFGTGFPFPPDLLAALEEHASMKGHETKRRHAMAGRVMREHPDPEALLLHLRKRKTASTPTPAPSTTWKTYGPNCCRRRSGTRLSPARNPCPFPKADAAKLKHLVQGAIGEKQNSRPHFHGNCSASCAQKKNMQPQGQEWG